jgi:hypothetical protein
MSDDLRREDDPTTSPILADAGRPQKTPAPGALASPQMPGQVPDRSTVPGHHSLRLGPPATLRRPLTEYGTAEEIARVFRKFGDAITPEEFEQATASWEELRKADPAMLPPARPAPGYVLDEHEEAPKPLGMVRQGTEF